MDILDMYMNARSRQVQTKDRGSGSWDFGVCAMVLLYGEVTLQSIKEVD